MADVRRPAHAAGAVGRGRGAGPDHRLGPAPGAAGPARRGPHRGAPRGHRGLSLPGECRTAVYLADIEGYPYREIAEMMGTPVGTVMSRLHRGRKKIREQLVA